MMRVVGIAGSLRPHSRTHQALDIVLNKLRQRGIEVVLLDVRDMKLPFCSGECDYPDYPDVTRLRDAVKQANGIVFASPEYHGTISGVLKNAIDLLDQEHLEDKVVGLISILGGAQSASSLDTLRTICRQLHAWTIPEQLIIAHSDQAFDQEGNLVDPEMPGRIDRFLNQLVDATRRFHS
jgi:NAD(P)H-dependent FMN reductase